ncbi:hypothetical protein CANDROIZ_270004 [Candidatus Roizmanbacteria bacterium]|nr:hypothetical protein CANDROIZ_270004 [Candidatus Roizmanbacteria bacterium]
MRSVWTISKKVLMIFIIIIISLIFFMPVIELPWGGAKDIDGDGRIDMEWSGTRKVSLFQILTKIR